LAHESGMEFERGKSLGIGVLSLFSRPLVDAISFFSILLPAGRCQEIRQALNNIMTLDMGSWLGPGEMWAGCRRGNDKGKAHSRRARRNNFLEYHCRRRKGEIQTISAASHASYVSCRLGRGVLYWRGLPSLQRRQYIMYSIACGVQCVFLFSSILHKQGHHKHT